eukprot:1013107-Amphidinium_carterae.1
MPNIPNDKALAMRARVFSRTRATSSASAQRSKLSEVRKPIHVNNQGECASYCLLWTQKKACPCTGGARCNKRTGMWDMMNRKIDVSRHVVIAKGL